MIMQVMLNIPDEIPQEIVNKLLMQFEQKIQAEKKLIIKSSLKASLSEDEIKIKAGQDLAQMVYKLRESAAEIGFVSEEEISQWVNDAREKHAGHY